MVGYGVDREWTLALRALVARYGELQAAGRGTVQRRGQQFNALVADLLRLWGIDAEAGVIGIEGRDEVDVTFTLGDTPYLLEAKWHARPVPADAASKLADHIRQRLRGTRGVVLSMSGYTRNAAPAAERGQQPEVLLLDRSHFEAMLSGLMAPDQLLQAVVRQASRRGGVYVPLADVVGAENVVRAGQAACRYSWRMPPSRSRRRMSSRPSGSGSVIGWGSGRRGAAARSVRWGRCLL